MLLKCCLISIIFLKNISCDDLAPEAKTTNIKKLSDSTNNPLTNRVQLTNDTGRYLNEYYVVINDQYIIKIFRLTYENYEIKSEKYPVLLVHGLFQSSDRFLQQRDNQSLAFKLQDFGYDVWLANFRGNKYGRRHTSFGDEIKDKAHFFNYSYEEIALQDIAATVDFILDNTKQEKIHYIGYSLGGTIFLVLNSMKQEYNNKFDTAHLLAPFGYQNYFPNKDLEVEASRCDEIYEKLLNVSTLEIFPYEPSSTDILFSAEQCFGNNIYRNICNLLKINEAMGIQSQGNKINETRGGSIKQIVHLAQNVKSKRFSRWDYGEKENEDHYGTKEPPKYNLSVITVETKIIFAPYDEYVSPKDIADMAANMVNATTREIGRKGIADMPTNMGNATSRKVEIEDVSGITTDTGNDRTRDVGRSGITDMPTNVSSATPREVTSMTTEDIDSTAIEVGEKGITDMPTDIGNAQSRVVEIEEVTGMTSIGDAATRKVGREGNPDVPTRMSYAILREVKHEDVTDMTTNIVEATTIGESTRDFKHNDFIDAPDVMELVYDNIINDLEKRSEHNAAIGRENKIKLSDNKTNTNEEETEDQQVKEKLRKTNWLIVALIPGLILFSLLLFMCLVRSIDFDCHMEM
ncbi:lipase 3-like isoform X1 [Cydia fagiglandana]|uniref:lipase 3-like isoform X1 n=1 Tax=Cydia fagiglandana TaxID=1458189 RepID=UPI002FEE3C25